METMGYREKRKKGNGIVVFILLLLALGGTVIYYALKTEREPVVIGQASVDSQSLKDLKTEEESASIPEKNVNYEVKSEHVGDKSNAKFVGDITLPVVSIEGTNFDDLNSTIKKNSLTMFETLKKSCSNVDNKYSYNVSYSTYENVVDNKKVLSITVHDKTMDLQLKSSIRDRVSTYNVELSSKKILKQSDLILSMLGTDCKAKIKDIIKNYVVSNNYVSESNYNYTYTGLENFYIKEGKFHLLFNEGDIVDKKYGIIDIVIE